MTAVDLLPALIAAPIARPSRLLYLFAYSLAVSFPAGDVGGLRCADLPAVLFCRVDCVEKSTQDPRPRE